MIIIGDSVVAGDVLLEIETDKAGMDVEAVEDGILAKILASLFSLVSFVTDIFSQHRKDFRFLCRAQGGNGEYVIAFDALIFRISHASRIEMQRCYLGRIDKSKKLLC